MFKNFIMQPVSRSGKDRGDTRTRFSTPIRNGGTGWCPYPGTFILATPGCWADL